MSLSSESEDTHLEAKDQAGQSIGYDQLLVRNGDQLYYVLDPIGGGAGITFTGGNTGNSVIQAMALILVL